MMGSSHQDQSSQELLQGFSSLAAAAAPSNSSFCEQWNPDRGLNCDDFNISSADELPASGQRVVRSSQGTSFSVPYLIQDLGFPWAINASDGLMPENSFDQKLNGFRHQEKLLLPPWPDLPENSSFETCGGAGGEYLNVAFPYLPVISAGSSDMETNAVVPESLKRGFCQLPSFTSARVLPRDDHEDESALQGTLIYHHHKMPSLVSGVSTEEEKGSMISSWELGQKSSKTAAASSRNPRFEQRSLCSPFKVRKEKLRDRVAALQQLVAPFGKTDTSTVLTEAVGYIKFLLDQVEKLSVPYTRPSGNKRSRTTKELQESEEEDSSSGEPKRDLKSRGLCLVPLSFTSYMATEHEHAFWSTWSPTI